MGMGLLGAMGGLGQAGQQVGQQMMQAALKEDEMKYLESQRLRVAEAEMKMKSDYANKERTDRVARVATAKDGLLNRAIDQKYAASDVAVADVSAGKTDMPLTDEQTAVIQQSKNAERAKLSADPRLDMQAEHASGDMSGREYGAFMMSERRADRQEKKDEDSMRLATLKQALAETSEARKERQTVALIAKMAASGGGGSGGGSGGELPSDARMVEYLVSNGIAKDKTSAYSMVKEGKRVADSYSESTKIDPIANKPITTTTVRGAGAPPTANKASAAGAGPWTKYQKP